MFEYIEDEDLRSKAIADFEARQKEVNEGIDKKIAEATERLVAKNTELLGEKKTIQEKLAEFKDITDPEKALEALNFINENEDAQLIKDGKVNELIEKRTSVMRIEHETAVQELADKLMEATEGQSTFKNLYETKVMDDAMRAVAVQAGVRIEAIPDVLLRAKSVFSLDKSGAPEARDEKGNLIKNKDDNVVTPAVWMEDLKTTSPHYWPTSAGAGALGSGVTDSADVTAKLADLAKRGDMKGYRKLRAQMGGGS